MDMDVPRARAELDAAGPEQVIQWAVEVFSPSLAVSSSFQTQSLPLLHMVSKVAPELPILFLDTGFHFPETLAFRDRIAEEWGLNLKNLRRLVSLERSRSTGGPDLYRTDPDLCCYVNKVEPMRAATQDLDGWISGIRRDQSAARADIRVLERTPGGTIRIHPMAAWTSRDIFQYISDHGLPEHPLLAQGYLSVGCAPCTRPAAEGEDERSGRWVGQEKTECGLHTELRGS